MGKNLANFEGLIRGAIAAKQALTPEARSEVYQSSRNALSRLIEGNRTLTVESAMQEQSALEEAILRIESEFVRFAPVEPSQPLPESEPIPTYESASGVESDVPIGSGSEFTSTSPMEPGGTTAEPSIGSPGSHVADRMAVNIDEDPLAELKEILLEDSDDALRESLDPSGFQSSSIAQSGTDDEIAMRTEPVGTASVDEPPAQHPEPTLLDSDPAVQVHADDPNSSAVAPEAPQLEGQAEMADAVTGDKPVTEPSAYDDKENMPLEFARRRRKQKIVGWLLAILVILALLGWLAYYMYIGVIDGTLFGLNTSKPAQNPNAPTNQAAAANYINILEPGDLSALITSNRGQAELVNELNLEMVRIVSVRDDVDRTQAANPILLRLKPGVLEQISGKNVTFEIYAKSASPSPAQFTVKCQFGSLGSCGRKRFRVGLQPEASIFAFDLGEVVNPDLKAYIAISTDTTANAATTGRGDVIDIVYARLRANN